MNKKGFTLIEVLAVIILLGLIATILIPNYTKTVEKGKKNAFKESLNGLVRSIENYVANNSDDLNTYKSDDYTDLKSITLEAMNDGTIKSGSFRIDSDDMVELKNVYNGTYCGSGTKNNWTITKGTCK